MSKFTVTHKITIAGIIVTVVGWFVVSGNLTKVNVAGNNNATAIGPGARAIVNVGSSPRVLNNQFQEQLKKAIPRGSMVNIIAIIGDQEAFDFANQTKTYLENNGYKVDGVTQSLFGHKQERQTIYMIGEDTYQIIIGSNQ